MKMDQYIAQLLYRYQCVTVPGFGAFLTEIQSAQLNEGVSHTFYPPKKLISFNAHLKNNDGLLAHHIAQSEKMSYEMAVFFIENQVATWKSKLNDLGSITITNIGDFTLNTERNLVFVPYDQVNYLTSSFGLTTYVSPAVKREVYKEEMEVLEEKTLIAFTPEKTSSGTRVKYAALFALGVGLLGAGGFFGNQYYQNQIQQETLALQTKVQKQVEQKIQEATFIISNPLPAVKLTVSEEKKPYHIVAGAFENEKNATKMKQMLTNLGYPARRIPQNKHGLFPVVYKSFSSYSEAHNEMQKIKKTHNQDAWLLILEL